MESYHKALTKEILQFAQLHEQRAPLATLFMGGGTPSTYPSHLLLDTFGILKEWYGFTLNAECTIEVNPGTVDMHKLQAWKEAGINRLSVGVQSLNDEVLKGLNRHQKAADVMRLFETGFELFPNISVDLIIGLPGVSEENWKADLQELMRWPLKHISLYFLTVHEETPLYYGVKQKKIALLPDDSMVDRYNWSVAELARHGFVQYEVSNFAQPGYASAHNKAYWLRQPYKGFGLGAASFDGTSRLQNDKRLLEYMASVENNTQKPVLFETLTPEEVWLETLMLGLRQKEGIEVTALCKDLSSHQRERFLSRIESCVQNELLVYMNDRVVLTSKGLALATEITVQLSSL